MNRLYLLGALALSHVSAYVNVGTTTTVAAPTTGTTYGTISYTGSGDDCYATGTATTLGMNNIYYQFYQFTVTAPTVTYGTYSLQTSPAAVSEAYNINAVVGCYHSHMYNWMGQPQLGSSAVTDGISDAVVAYGYVMGGNTLAACTLSNSVVTTTLWTSTTKAFVGGRFQHVNAIISPAGIDYVVSTVTAGLLTSGLVHYGQAALQTVTNTASTYALPGPGVVSILGVDILSTQNVHWDFAQSQVFQGQTQFGRGGGSTDAPCGWWVFYAHEGGVQTQGGGTQVSTWNVASSMGTATVNMWTDNAMTNTIGAFVLAALGAALY